MSTSREDSPDWLRSFQAPTVFTTLSSDSEPSGYKSPARDDADRERDEGSSGITIKYGSNKSSNKNTSKKRAKASDEVSAKRRKTEKQKKKGSEEGDIKEEGSSEKLMETHVSNHLVLALSSDSESDSNAALKKEEANEESSMDESLKLVKDEEKNDKEESSPKVTRKGKSPKKQIKTETIKPSEKKKTNDNMKIEEEVDDVDAPEGIHEKHVEPRVSSSTLPLILPEKVNRSKALVECEGESIDLSGDMGAVGRIIIPEAPSKNSEMFLDLKGTIYKTTIVPSRTFCVVSIGQSEAKIEAIMNDFIHLTPQSNVYDAETMVEGTLDGFSFDSEDEADKMTKDVKGDQNEGAEENNEKPGRKAERKKGATQKKAKAAGGKAPKKKKPQTTKKGKSKK